MRFSVGDMMFSREGRPAVVIGREPTGHVIAERKGEKFEKARKLGFINGLAPNQRSKFVEIVKEAKEKAAPEERVQHIQERVNELQTDPKNWVLKRYLESEMAYIMNSEGIHPNTFVFDETDIT